MITTTWGEVRVGDTVHLKKGASREVTRVVPGPDGITVWAQAPDGERAAVMPPNGVVLIDRPDAGALIRELSGPGTEFSTILNSPADCADFLRILLELPPKTRIHVTLEPKGSNR